MPFAITRLKEDPRSHEQKLASWTSDKMLLGGANLPVCLLTNRVAVQFAIATSIPMIHAIRQVRPGRPMHPNAEDRWISL
jgi:hypothetical protein